MPCSLADTRADQRRAGRPPRARVLAQAGGSASAEECRKGEGDARQNLGPGRPGRPRRSCSLQQVRRTHARSLLLSRHLLRWSRFAGETLAIGPAPPAPRGWLPPALLPSPGSSQPPPALPGRGGGRHGLLLASAPPRGQLPHPAGSSLRVSTAPADSGRPPAPLLLGSGFSATASEDSPSSPRTPLPASTPRRQAAVACRLLSGEPRTKPRGWGLPRSSGVGGGIDPGFRLPQSSVWGELGRGAQSQSRVSGLGLQFTKAWPCNGGSQLEVRKRMEGETGTEGSWSPVGRAGPRLEGGSALPPLPSRRPLPPKLRTTDFLPRA